MKKILVRAALILSMLVVMTAAASSWIQTNWPAGNSYFDLYASQNHVFARIWDTYNGGRVFLTTDNGANWTQISSAEPDIDILSMVLLDPNILAGTWDGFYRSTDGGTTFTAFSPGGVPAGTPISALALIDATLFAGATGHIYQSADNGNTWTDGSSGITTDARILSFASSGSAIFAGSASNGVFTTTNGGTSWTAANSGLGDTHISQLAALGTRLFAVTLTGVFISDNGGTSWTADGSGLEHINCLAVVGNQLYAGTDASGVYLSTDSGATWSAVPAGMPDGTRVWSLATTCAYLFAGTDSGVWSVATGAASYTISASASAGGTISPAGDIPVCEHGSRTFTITPQAGYRVSGVLVDGVPAGAIGSYTFTDVTDDHTIAASFDLIPSYTINASAGAGGTISPSGSIVLLEGSAQKFTIAPQAGYRLSDVRVDEVSIGAVSAYTFTNVTADHTIYASFDLIPSYTINASAGAGGTISPSGSIVLLEGSAQKFTIAPQAGYRLSDVLVDEASVGAVSAYTFTNVTADHTIYASFDLIPSYTIGASAGAGGTISPAGSIVLLEGSSQTFTMTPQTGYCLASLTVDGSAVEITSVYTFTNVVADHTIAAAFALNRTIRKQVDQAAASPGDTLTYTMDDIGYTQSDLLSSVRVTDTLPAGATYVADSATPEATEGAGVLIWNLGSNTPGVPGAAAGGSVSVLSATSTPGGINNASSLTFSYAPGAGSSRLLLVGVSWSGEGEDESYARTVAGVTFAGAPLTPVPGGTCYQSYNRRMAMYYLKETFGTTAANVVVTFSGPVWAVAGAVTFAGVDQTTPLGPFSCSTGNSTTPSVTLTGLNGNELVFDTVAANNNLNNFNVGANQTQRWNMNQQSDNTSGVRGAASTEQATGSSVTMSWSTSNTTWASGAVPVRPAGAGSTTLAAYNTLVSTGRTITLTATFANATANNNVIPGSVTTTPAGGASCSGWTGPTLVTADDDISGSGDPVTYRWTCTASGGTALPSSLTFSVAGSGDGAVSYPAGTSNSVLVAPALTFQVTVNNPPEACRIDNTATLDDGGAYIAPTDSNTATTAVRRYTLTVGSDGHGSVTLDPSGGVYTCDETVTLTPVPADGYSFVGWVGPNAGEVAGNQIVMSAIKSVVANFAAGGNHPPALVELVTPQDHATGVYSFAPLRVKVSDADSNQINVSFYVEDEGPSGTASAQAFLLQGTAYAVDSGADAYIWPQTLDQYRTYLWYVEISDGAATTRAPGETDYWTFSTGGPTRAELTALAASTARGGIVVQWDTASDVDNLGFTVWRARSATGERERLTARTIPSQAPGSASGGHYRYVDRTVLPGVTFYYWVERVGVDGATDLHGPVRATASPYFKPPPVRQ